MAAAPIRSRISALDDRRRRLLDHLLVAALQRALALTEVEDMAVGVGEHLDLDVARPLQVALGKHAAVAEGGVGLAPGGRQRALELGLLADDPHPLAAATRERLDHDRKAVLGGESGDLVASASAPPVPGTTGTPASTASCLARPLSPISAIASGGGPTQVSPAAATAAAKCVFSLRKP